MPASLSTTSYALLGLLVFDRATSEDGLTGYELKQRADRTLRFYWVSPAMSQIYTELDRLRREGYVEAVDDTSGRRTTRRFVITDSGRSALTTWLHTSEQDFPVLKHPIALRLLMGSLMGPGEVASMLDAYEVALAERRRELETVREMLGDNEALAFPAHVAEWGLAYYDSEREIVDKLRTKL
ncbi:PadR family transcriptional regulator [Aeromicrobium chenweiae]|uniref:PadR family transcriptional regulator n=1 Tax=Aeromicrobium chenweiae TaxID=2079793 RepID=A0A2S0WMZ8_9ACTN|nr:PadR family transcriptional regulator [Aeromicrobium chenweiae]AWB92718.1 PadR family transcriptional regulator [Aeromicrobium chenweiae]TGN33709.1 PadR family transcriptional regulator [Aeromicrobium chenweiae]